MPLSPASVSMIEPLLGSNIVSQEKRIESENVKHENKQIRVCATSKCKVATMHITHISSAHEIEKRK